MVSDPASLSVSLIQASRIRTESLMRLGAFIRQQTQQYRTAKAIPFQPLWGILNRLQLAHFLKACP